MALRTWMTLGCDRTYVASMDALFRDLVPETNSVFAWLGVHPMDVRNLLPLVLVCTLTHTS